VQETKKGAKEGLIMRIMKEFMEKRKGIEVEEKGIGGES